MRRRALLAASAVSGGGNVDWSYELHLTPEWESIWGTMTWTNYDDYTIDLYHFLQNMTQQLGVYDEASKTYRVDDIPEECNITVDGERLSYVEDYTSIGSIYIEFGYDVSGTLVNGMISLDKVG